MQFLHAQVMRQQLFKGQAFLRGVVTLYQGAYVCIGWWSVNIVQCVGQWQQLELIQKRFRQKFFQFELTLAHQAQCLVCHFDPVLLTQALGSRIHRGQAVGDRLFAKPGEPLIGRVYHFKTLVAGPDFTETTQPRAAGQLLFLVHAKMKKPQRDAAGSIKQHHDQHRAAPAHDRGVFNFSFDQFNP